MKKIVVTVPVEAADQVRQAMGEAGAGKVGNYSFCSFSVRGVGRFMPNEGANPAIGEVGRSEQVEEERIEAPCEDILLDAVTEAIRRVHPYEEPVIDIFDVQLG
ncbi:MAG TPA: hypothetical protein VF829_03460 [Candidatus Paceibacterota bacterium]